MRILRLPIVTFCLGWLLASAAAAHSPTLPTALALLGAVACGLASWLRTATVLRSGAAGFFGAVLACSLVGSSAEEDPLASLLQEERRDLSFELRLLDGPRLGVDGASWEAEVLKIDDREVGDARVRLWTDGWDGETVAGDHVRVYGRASRLAPRDFPRVEAPRIWGARHGIVGRVVAREPLRVLRRDDEGWRSTMAKRRLATEALLVGSMPRQSAVATAMLTGTRLRIDDATWETFRDSGTAHVLAISGLHFGTLAALMWWFGVRVMRRSVRVGRRIGARRAAAGFVVLAMGAYLFLVGAPVSALRAWIFVTVVAAAVIAARRPTVWGALSIAAVAVTFGNPSMVDDLGFRLSFGASVGIALFWTNRPDWLRFERYRLDPEAWWRRALRKFGCAAGVSWAASLATAPFLAATFGVVSWTGFFTNLVAVPWVSLIVFPLLLVGASVGAAFPGAAALPLEAADICLDTMVGALRLFDGPSALVVVGSGTFALRILTPAAVALTLALLRRRDPTGLVALFLCAVAWLGTGDRYPSDGLRVHFIPVGQGDAVLLESQRERILVDAGGSRWGRDPGRHVVVPYLYRLGIDRLDAVVVTHEDFDHVGGLPGVLGRIEVAQTVREPRELERSWLQLFRATDEGPRNDRSIVAIVRRGGVRLLLTGDIEATAELSALDRFPTSLVLKVAHHGSKTSTTPEFLDRVRPRVGIVSAGRHNRFGHPHPDVVARLRRRGVELFSTAENGLVVVEMKTRSVVVRTVR